MSAIYDNWERLVGAVLKKEQLWQLFHADSVSVSSDSSGFSFAHSTSSLDDFTFGWPASSTVVETIENVKSTPPVGRVSVAEQRSYPLPLPPKAASRGRERDEDIVESPRSPWKKGKLLGEGLLGGLYLAFNNESGGMCNMKEVPLSSYGDVQQSARIWERDIMQLSHMRHPNIVQFYGSETKYGRLGEAVISSYTRQILSGLSCLHSKNIAHRGIKGANVLINPNGTVKLSNFGVETRIAEQLHSSWMMESPYWMAPEAMAMNKVACYKSFPTIPDHLSYACKDFLRNCLRWNPCHRATASRLLEHPFVKGFSPWAGQVLVSTSSVTNHVKPEDTDQAGKVVSNSSKASRSDFRPRQRKVLAPTSPIPLPRPPQQIGARKSTPPEALLRTPSTSSTLIGVSVTQHPHLNQSMLHQHTFCNFPYQSPNVSSPCYWDPNILKGIFSNQNLNRCS